MSRRLCRSPSKYKIKAPCRNISIAFHLDKRICSNYFAASATLSWCPGRSCHKFRQYRRPLHAADFWSSTAPACAFGAACISCACICKATFAAAVQRCSKWRSSPRQYSTARESTTFSSKTPARIEGGVDLGSNPIEPLVRFGS